MFSRKVHSNVRGMHGRRTIAQAQGAEISWTYLEKLKKIRDKLVLMMKNKKTTENDEKERKKKERT